MVLTDPKFVVLKPVKPGRKFEVALKL